MKGTFLAILAVAACGHSHAQVPQPPLHLVYNQPAQYFEEAIPIGNGRMGAMVYGGTGVDSLQLNDISFWTGKPVDHDIDADAYRWLPKVREALFNEDYRTADSLQRHLQGPDSQYYMPLGNLYIRWLTSGTPSDYQRTLDLDSAVCRDSYRLGSSLITREYIASAPDSLIAIHLHVSEQGALNFSLRVNSQVPHQVKASQGQLTMTGHAVGDPLESIHFCTIIRTQADDKAAIDCNADSVTVQGATDVTVWLVNETSFNGFDKHPVREGAPYVEQAADRAWHTANTSYEKVRARHVQDYRHFFTRFKLALGGAKFNPYMPTDLMLRDYANHKDGNPYLETLYTQFGRYLLISCSRTKGIPANLNGLWSHKLWAPWRGNYTVNINLEENYWPAEVGNLPEMTMPLYTFVEELAQNGCYVARNYYGVQAGWCSSHNSDLWAMANPVGAKTGDPTWANWNMGGAWLTQNLWEHFAFSLDTDYLRTTAYPLMRGASQFASQWLVENPKSPNHELITAPSTSPEAYYSTPDGYRGATLYGGTADLAIIRELFRNSVTAARCLNADSDLSQDWQQKEARLHPYTVGKEGDLNEWYYDWADEDIHHRHQSHLIGLYPGHQITVEGTPDLAEASTRSLYQRGDKTTGWSSGWRINLWARLHRGDQAYHLFQRLLNYVEPDGRRGETFSQNGGTYPNLFDAHPPFQIDGNFGGTAGVCEMLIQSQLADPVNHEAVVELLPALPASWQKGEVSGIRARGGLEVDFAWDGGKVTRATLHSAKGCRVTVKYNGKERTLTLRPGQKKTIR